MKLAYLVRLINIIPAAAVSVEVGSAQSKDLSVLTRVVYAAFLAEQSAAVCIAQNPAFRAAASGPIGDAHSYAEHIKSEVTAGLNDAEARRVILSAADLARTEALQAIRGLRTGVPNAESARLAEWCETIAEPLIRQVISTHDTRHAQVDDLLRKAKTD